MPPYTLKQLLVFKETIKEGSMNKAARNLSMNQSGVSRIIQQLEGSLGFKLFSRNKNTLLLTRSGNDFLTSVDKLIESLSGLDESIEQIQQGVRELRIGVPTGFSVQFAPEIIRRYLEREKNLHIRLDVRSSHSLCDDVQRGYLDMALVAEITRTSNQTLHHRIVGTPLVCIVHKDHPLADYESVTVNDILKHNIIFPSKLDIAGVWVDSIAKKRFNRAKITSNIGSIIGLVNQGLGLAVLNVITVTDLFTMNDITIIPIEPVLPLYIYFICRYDWMENHDIEVVLDSIEETVNARKRVLRQDIADLLVYHPLQ